jgi:hypothetical protein
MSDKNYSKTELLVIIGELRREQPRNGKTMLVCEYLERALAARVTVGVGRFDKRAWMRGYMREYMRRRRGTLHPRA